MPISVFPRRIEAGAVAPVFLGLPQLHVSIARSGWLLGTPGNSELGTTTVLGYAGFDEIPREQVRRCKIDRGRSHELDRVETGKAGLRLANRDGAFDPTNTASPYHPDIRPMIPIRVQASFATLTYDLFNGFAEGWPQQWTRGPTGDAWVDVTVVDGFKVLNLARVTLDREAELSGARVDALLDAIGWPSDQRVIDAGESMVQAVTLAGTSPLQHIQDVAASEGGLFFFAADGRATFYGRHHFLALEDDDTWGDLGDEKDYEALTYTSEDANLWNEVTVTAPGLADQTARDTASQSLFGGLGNAPRVMPPVSTLLTTEAEMLERAEHLVARYSSPELRVVQVSPEPRGDDSQWPRILVKDIHHRVGARKRPPYGGLIDQPSMIEGISYDIHDTHWGVEWRLSSTLHQVGTWQLGVPGRSELGVTTSLVNTIQ